jgi:uncharacterized protein (TIGR00106 family)
MFGFLDLRKIYLAELFVVDVGGIKLIIAQLSIAPIGVGTSLSKYVKKAVNVLREENIKFENNAMATVIETEDLDTLFNVVQKAHNTMLDAGVKRVITELKIDDRRDKDATAKSKINAIQ